MTIFSSSLRGQTVKFLVAWICPRNGQQLYTRRGIGERLCPLQWRLRQGRPNYGVENRSIQFISGQTRQSTSTSTKFSKYLLLHWDPHKEKSITEDDNKYGLAHAAELGLAPRIIETRTTLRLLQTFLTGACPCYKVKVIKRLSNIYECARIDLCILQVFLAIACEDNILARRAALVSETKEFIFKELPSMLRRAPSQRVWVTNSSISSALRRHELEFSQPCVMLCFGIHQSRY